MDLLDPEIAPPSSDVLAAELGRLDIPADEHFLNQAGPLRFTADPDEEPSPLAAAGGRKVAVGIAGLLAVALVGLLIGISALGGKDKESKAEPVGRPSSSAPADQPTQPAPARKLTVQDVRIVDPDSRSRDELSDAEKVIDGSEDEGWQTDTYKSPKFGNFKRGMGVWIDLGSEHTVKSVKAVLSASGATAQLYTGTTDPGASSSGDKKLYTEYVKSPIGEGFAPAEGTTLIFSNGFDPDKKYRYLLFWLTELPSNDRGYKIGVQEITVQGS